LLSSGWCHDGHIEIGYDVLLPRSVVRERWQHFMAHSNSANGHLSGFGSSARVATERSWETLLRTWSSLSCAMPKTNNRNYFFWNNPVLSPNYSNKILCLEAILSFWYVQVSIWNVTTSFGYFSENYVILKIYGDN